jgi:YVTN family beta-propeller protein
VDFRILGPLQVFDGDGEVQLGAPKERALLAVLLLHAGAVVSRERLIDELWGEAPPPTATKALNVHVSQLRKALARNGHDPIATDAPGYALRIDPDLVDVARFERLGAEARGQVASGQTQSARELFQAALALWRGAPLAGVELESVARGEIGRLEGLRLSTLMDRIDCDLALGLQEQVIGELEALVAEHPLHERLRGQYMLALYRAGRQADALAAYQDTRSTLVHELGLEPSEALQRLERGILNHDPALELPQGIRGTRGATGKVPWPRRRSLVLVAMLVLLLAAFATAVVATRSHGGVSAPPNSVVIIDPSTNKVTHAVGVGIDPGAVSIGAGAVWVANMKDKTLSSIDPGTRKVTANLNLEGTPTGVAATPHAVWVAYGRLGSVAKVDPEFGSVGPALKIAGRGYGFGSAEAFVAAGAEGTWVAFGDSTVARISADGTRVLTRGYAGYQPSAIALGERAVWVANAQSNNLTQLDPGTGRAMGTTSVALRPRGLAVGGGAVWVSAFDDDVVSRVEGGSSRTIPVGDGPFGVAFGAGSVWVANSLDGTVSRIDPDRDRVVATIRVGHHPVGIAVDGNAVWVTVRAG